MRNRARLYVQAVCVVAASATAAAAQLPTFSLEAVAVGSQPIAGGPVNRVVIAPGDALTTKIFLRDWSPNGERLGAYQVQMDPDGYASGSTGFVHPPNYRPDRRSQDDDQKNCTLDVFDSQFVHTGLAHLPLTDSVSNGYRWTSILVRPEHGPIADQDGQRYYCGSLNLVAMDDSSGAFTIGFIENTNATGLRSELGLAILPNAFEPLVVVVRSVDWNASSLVEALVEGLNGVGDPSEIPEIDIDADDQLAPTDLLWLIDLANH